MSERIRRLCPYQNCGWHYDEPPLEPDLSLTVEGNLALHTAAVEEVCKAHLDSAHSGWTLADVERESLASQVRTVFNASPFSPTWSEAL